MAAQCINKFIHFLLLIIPFPTYAIPWSDTNKMAVSGDHPLHNTEGISEKNHFTPHINTKEICCRFSLMPMCIIFQRSQHEVRKSYNIYFFSKALCFMHDVQSYIINNSYLIHTTCWRFLKTKENWPLWHTQYICYSSNCVSYHILVGLLFLKIIFFFIKRW